MTSLENQFPGDINESKVSKLGHKLSKKEKAKKIFFLTTQNILVAPYKDPDPQVGNHCLQIQYKYARKHYTSGGILQ